MTVLQMENVSQIFGVLAIVFAVISIVLFFVFDIRRILRISNKRYLKEAEQVSFKNIQADLKNEQEKLCITEELLNDYSGAESTELISDKQNQDLAITLPITESYKNEIEDTVLLTHKGSDPTELLDTEGVSVLQDIIYTNDYSNT